MGTIQNNQHNDLPTSEWLRRWTVLLYAVAATLILAAITTDLLLPFRNFKDASWFSDLLLVLTIIGIAFSIARLVYLRFLYRGLRGLTGGQPVSVVSSNSTEAPIVLHIPSDESPRSPMLFKGKTSYRSIEGTVPPTDSRTIVQREKLVNELYRRMTKSDTTAIVLTGMAGVGKSTLAALIYRYVKRQHPGSSYFPAKPLWFNIDTDATMADLAGNIFQAFGKPTPDFRTMTPHSQAATLFNLLNAVEQSRLIILDQFENILDWQNGDSILDPAIRIWLTAINSEKCKCRILLTSRNFPQQIHPLTFIQEYSVKGLEIKEGMELLRKQGVQGTDEALGTAVQYCGGHALALTLLASLIKNQQIDLEDLFSERTEARLWMGDIATNLLNYIYNRELNEEEHKLLLAFSIYREPVTLEAAKSVANLSAEISEAQIHAVLKLLIAQHLIQSSGRGRYHLHAVVISYIQKHFVENDEQANQQALREAHARAAGYYRQQAARKCPPRERRQDISDVREFIESIWQLCQAEQWQEAYDLMEREEIFADLKRWGGNAILLELFENFTPLEKWSPRPSQAIRFLTNLGRVYRTLGQRNLARVYLEQALDICEREEDRWVKGMVLSFLGRVYADLGQKKTALKYLTEALEIRRETEDREGEGWTLDILGEIYDDLGQMEYAINYSERALKLREEIGDRRGVGRTLITLSRTYDNLGKVKQAHTYLEQALLIWKEVKDRTGEALTLNRLGLLYAGMGKKDEALKYYEQALAIEREIGDRGGETRTLNHLGNLHSAFGEKEQALHLLEQALGISRDVGDYWWEGRILTNLGIAYYEQQQLDRALDCLEKGLAISINSGDQRGEAWAKYNLGRVYIDFGEKEKSLLYFEEAWRLHKKIGSRRKEGRIMYTIGLNYFKWQRYDAALASLLLARDIYQEIGSPEAFKSDSYIDKLREEIGEDSFSRLLAEVAPKADQIIEQAFHEMR